MSLYFLLFNILFINVWQNEIISMHCEGKEKSSRHSLRETRDKRPVSSDPDRSRCHRHDENDKAFMVAVHGSMGIGGSIGQGVKFSA